MYINLSLIECLELFFQCPRLAGCIKFFLLMKTKEKNMKPNSISGLTAEEWKIIREIKVLMTMTLEELMMVEVRGIPVK